ncbi:cyclin-dependent kinase 20-like [Eudromia elegans]
MERYVILGRVGEGAHGVVFKAKDREVLGLRAFFAQGPALVLALELAAGDLGGLLRAAPAPLPPARVRRLLAMTLRGVGHCHGLRLLHRDLKPANLLLDGAGRLKLADFGLARVLAPHGPPRSPQVATRWYRAPELLYGARHYDEGVDLWAVGCIFGELLTLSPLPSRGENDLEQLCCILRVLGTPSPHTWPVSAPPGPAPPRTPGPLGPTLPPSRRSCWSFPITGKSPSGPRAPLPLERLLPDAAPEALDLLRRFLR